MTKKKIKQEETHTSSFRKQDFKISLYLERTAVSLNLMREEEKNVSNGHTSPRVCMSEQTELSMFSPSHACTHTLIG